MAKGDILFITWSRLGDALLSNGLLDHLARTVPNARITVACGPVAADLYRSAPSVTHVHVMYKGPRAAHWRGLMRLVSLRHWEYVVDLRSSAIAYTLWANHRHVFRAAAGDVHKAKQIGDLFGLKPPPAAMAWADAAAVAKADALVPTGPLFAVGPTTNWPGKQWPVEKFVTLLAEVTGPGGPFAGHKVLVLGGPGEEAYAAPIKNALGAQAVDLVGQLSPSETFAALRHAAFFIGNDSGLMHMACSARLPVVALFGPSNDAVYGPYGVPHRIVRAKAMADILSAPDYKSFGSDVCYMNEIDVPMAAAAVRDLALECGLSGAVELS